MHQPRAFRQLNATRDMDMSRPKIDGVNAQIPTTVFTPSAEGDTKVIIDIGGSG